MKVSPLVGYKSFNALYAFHKLLLGLKMTPAYLGEPYEAFYAGFDLLTEDEKEKLVREAAIMVDLTESEVLALVQFACDKNGISYGPHNLNSMAPNQIHEAIVAVCMEIGKIEINILSPSEKKKSALSLSTQEPST